MSTLLLRRFVSTTHESTLDERNEKLNNIIDKVLSQMLGREATEIFYDHLRATHSIQRQNLVQEFDLFSRALKEYLGSGAVIIEQVIHRNLELIEPEMGHDPDFLDKSRMLKLV